MKTTDNFKPGLEGKFQGTINGREYKVTAETVYDENFQTLEINWDIEVVGREGPAFGAGCTPYDRSFGPLVTTADVERFAAELAEQYGCDVKRQRQWLLTLHNAAIEAAENLDELRRLLNHEWYEWMEGCYGTVPTWGDKTERVQARINSSRKAGDLVSWDTRSADPTEHRYIFRRHTPAGANQHEFYIQTEAEIRELES